MAKGFTHLSYGILSMIEKSTIKKLVEEFLTGYDPEVFLVDIKVSGRNHIGVFLDGDKGVPISKCIDVSRHIESSFDRDVEDFELEVSSVGIDRPLVMPRQFKKNIGRNVAFTGDESKKIKGLLVNADEKGFTIEKELPKKKKKNTEPDEDPVQFFPYESANDVKVQVSFKSA